ncbi:molybdenum ABC transporter permease ModB [Spiribacter salinus M19-40]|jgi:molybdate transport system permease protein|uniref:Molybdenum transport system permease n=1 Tax=Spiribacter salinus M19-40 TaxID=1260251 RepID=R4VDA5_9GAMM|nr:molybdate ABC transporter permease subunit [Spiribacter salinus]AGM40291.1 molybdenum ABC transporter permease ModB [Spiribacter salinus M19-40]MBY5269214.1 molybdenum ABC transporter permease subunit [Spiribacter salinus]MDR9414470.1 molybdate ABC transporter permease subunit [Spiribacter sp.]MDR9455527.1 molybdate ABC transporter permease subunit [Spiribacter sp.]
MNLTPVWLSIQLASVTVVVLLALGTPLAWWLATTRHRLRVPIDALVALPLVLPPTVLGFYLLILLGPRGPIGGPWLQVTGETLTFSFTGLVIASVLYSLPFVVQPLRDAFRAVGAGPMEVAATLGARPLDAFLTIACPLAGRGFLTAIVLGFAHTLGEFGAVLMVGGSIPGETRVVGIAIYEHVETLNYPAAHLLSAGLLIFSFVVLVLVYALNRRARPGLIG